MRRKALAVAKKLANPVRPLADAVAFRIGAGRKRSPRATCLGAAEWAPWRNVGEFPPLTREERAALLVLAARACRHEFDLLGSGPVLLGDEIDWNRDFKSGHRWNPRRGYTASSMAELPPGVDIKVPWELSRCQHFVTLAIADLLTGDPRYYEEFQRQVRHWVRHNPVGRGANWICTMDVGIRAVNWITALQLFRERIETSTDAGFLATVVDALWMAGCHTRRNLEWGGAGSDTAGNHFIANLAGLIGIGAFFRHTARGREWLEFGRSWMIHELQRQVHPDGSHFETSTAYHRLVMEMFAWSRAVCERLGVPMPAEFDDRLARMADFVTAYRSPSGDAVQFGDNDNGRFLTAGIRAAADHSHLAGASRGIGAAVDRWLLGLPASEIGGTDPAGVMVFRDGGYAFGEVPDAWVGFRAGPVTRHGSHTHCDQLSFVLNVHGQDVVVDRGTGVYGPDIVLRNRLRSTTAHATPIVNGWEQNRFDPHRKALFSMADDTRARLVRVERVDDGVEMIAEHEGFARERAGLIVRRQLRLSATSLVVEDTFERLCPGDTIEWRVPLRPGLRPRGSSETSIEIPLTGSVVTMCTTAAAPLAVIDDIHSASYGLTESAVTIVARTTIDHSAADQLRVTWQWNWHETD